VNDPIVALEADLNSFDLAVRSAALDALLELAATGKIPLKAERAIVNLHCHTFFSFNAYGYSPTALAWLAKKEGYRGLGIVDFDVLDGVDEFLKACDRAEVRGTAGIETRVFIPEFGTREINSPGEPGVCYHMGVGFTSSSVPQAAMPLLNDLRERAAQRYHEMVERINAHLAPVQVDYERDILPLTPAGNPTERHIVTAYIQAAERQISPVSGFWANKLGNTTEEIEGMLHKPAAFQNHVRSKLMKKGGVGYIQPSADTFPSVEVFHRLISACGALPCAAWLDGTSEGEQAIDELLGLLVKKGVRTFNIIPDRNWNIADASAKQVKVQKLYAVVEAAQRLALPLNIGTEMNSFGQRLVDDFDAPELAPVRDAFLAGADVVYGHTVLQRQSNLGYESTWAEAHFPSREQRNAFYQQVGALYRPGHGAGLKADLSPEQILQILEKV